MNPILILTNTAKFPIGTVVMTNGIEDQVDIGEVAVAMNRYIIGDWGDLCKEDKELNEEALIVGNRLFAKYKMSDGTDIYIITEWDRSVTTILLPEEY